MNSIDTDGVKGGFDLPMLEAVCEAVEVPVIASAARAARGLHGLFPPRAGG